MDIHFNEEHSDGSKWVVSGTSFTHPPGNPILNLDL